MCFCYGEYLKLTFSSVVFVACYLRLVFFINYIYQIYCCALKLKYIYIYTHL